LGGAKAENRDFARSVSPLTYVTSSSSPVFIVHGDADPIVPYRQSIALHEKLRAHGVVTTLMTIKGGGHGKFSKKQNRAVYNGMMEFLTNLSIVEASQ
jgi:dipeptidyl aminopeptidase/acylaminoacyl peptidase